MLRSARVRASTAVRSVVLFVAGWCGGCGAASSDARPPGPDDLAGGTSGDDGGGAHDGGTPSADLARSDDLAMPPPTSAIRVIAYLPNYRGSYGDWAHMIDFHKMTHLNLAFATATAQNGWALGAADAHVKALLDAAHAPGTRLLA